MNKKTLSIFIIVLNYLLISCNFKVDKNKNSVIIEKDSVSNTKVDYNETIETTEVGNDESKLLGSWKNFELQPQNVDAPKDWILNFYNDNSYNFKFENKYYSPRIEWYLSGNDIVVRNSYATREIGEIKRIENDSLDIYFFDLKCLGKFVKISAEADKY